MNKLMPLEFKNRRILTTEQLGEVYGTDINNIQVNFKNHKDNFKEGKHYFLLQGDELKEFKRHLNNIQTPISISKFASQLYLWTERGANRHCKILDTDKAWEQFDNLEETYFKVKENVQALNTSELSPELQMFKQIFDTVAKQQLENKQIKAEIEETKEEIQGIRDITGLSSVDWKTDSKNLIVKIAHKLGGNQFIQDVYKEIYTNLEKRAGCQLEIRLTNKRRRMAEEGVCKSRRDKLNKLDIIGDEKKLLECFLAIVKELAIKYGV